MNPKPKATLTVAIVGGAEVELPPHEARVLEDLRCHFDMEGGWVQAIQLYPGKLVQAQEDRQMLRRLAARRLVKVRRESGLERFAPIIADVDERTCRQCACTDLAACHDDELGPCSWVEEDLCSHCETQPRRAG